MIKATGKAYSDVLTKCKKEDLADDYSYVVVGYPDHKFLFIMSRKSSISKKTHDELVARCKAMGYPVEKLVSQKHGGV
ncbi:lipocalin family protein [Mucilaginibacter sp.]|uniref:lipocalin family protein n=1 Tax=Mucilaginibacter sp. TaxID=1882438 RepID=UPI003264F6BA